MKYLDASERVILTAVVEDALAAGYLLSLDDGGALVLRDCGDLGAVLAAAGSTGSDTLTLRAGGRSAGGILFVWGNGCDCLADYTDNEATGKVVQRAQGLAESL